MSVVRSRVRRLDDAQGAPLNAVSNQTLPGEERVGPEVGPYRLEPSAGGLHVKFRNEYPCGCVIGWEDGVMTAEPCSEGHRTLLEVMAPDLST